MLWVLKMFHMAVNYFQQDQVELMYAVLAVKIRVINHSRDLYGTRCQRCGIVP